MIKMIEMKVMDTRPRERFFCFGGVCARKSSSGPYKHQAVFDDLYYESWTITYGNVKTENVKNAIHQRNIVQNKFEI